MSGSDCSEATLRNHGAQAEQFEGAGGRDLDVGTLQGERVKETGDLGRW